MGFRKRDPSLLLEGDLKMFYQQYPNYNYMNNNNNQDERLFVSNYQAAEAYPVAPNSFVRLWDSNANCFYEKRADASGRLYPIEIYEYKKKVTQNNDYQTELESLRARVEALEKGVTNESNADDSTV